MKEVVNIVGSIGGVGAIIVWLANWWGNRIAERISNKEKAQHEQELERIKTQLEITKAMVGRYNEQQFTLYNELWSSLFDLFSIGDDLWTRAERQKLVKFAKQLRSTKEAVEKGSLFIEDDHYQQLHNILDAFANYEAEKVVLSSCENLVMCKTTKFNKLLQTDSILINIHHLFMKFEIHLGDN